MALNGLGLGVEKGSTKDLIIDMLSECGSLTAKEIFHRVRKQNQREISYQAIHKLLNSLCRSKIVNKQDRNYSLNVHWILEKQLELAQVEKRITITKDEKETKVVTILFDSWHKAGQYLLRVTADELDVGPRERGQVFHNHLWWILSLAPEDYPRLKKLCSSKPYMICRNSTTTDKILAKMYSQMGCEVKLGVNYSCNYDFIVYKNKIYQTYFLDSLESDIDKAYKKMNTPTDFGSNFYKNFLQKKSKVQVIILENAELAEKLRQDVLKYFGGTN